MQKTSSSLQYTNLIKKVGSFLPTFSTFCFFNYIPFLYSHAAVLFIEDMTQAREDSLGCGFIRHHVRIILQALNSSFLSVVKVFRHIDHHIHQEIAHGCALEFPLPRRRNTFPGCVPGAIFTLALPSTIGTSAEPPSTAVGISSMRL